MEHKKRKDQNNLKPHYKIAPKVAGLPYQICELLGSKIENENENGNVTNDVAEQLSRINEQLAMKNRRSRRIWKAIAIILVVFFLISVFIIMTSIAAFITISQL